MQQLDYKTYYDKVLGGWVGKSAGGILGAPTEGWKRFNQIPLTDDLFNQNYPNDDLDLQILWLDMVKKYGPSVRENAFAEHWKKHVDFPWGEYGIAGRNLKLGVYPPDSGAHNNHYWQTGMGSPIRSEIWGMLNPGMPEQAAFYASMDSSLDHHEFSVDAEAFLAACASLAFFENDIHEIFNKAFSIFHHDSFFTEVADYVLELRETCTYENAIGKLKSRYGDADFTYAPMNVGLALIALLFNKPDFDELIKALHLGHDSDCICATVGSLYGVLIGFNNLPAKWKELVGDELLVSPEIVGLDNPRSLSDLAKQTCQAGTSFINFFDKIKLTDAVEPFPITPLEYNVNCILGEYHPADLSDFQNLIVEFENVSEQEQAVEISIQSEDLEFETTLFKENVESLALKELDTKFKLTEKTIERIINKPETIGQSFTYTVSVTLNDAVQQFERGIPYYGIWLLCGPFIQEDEALAPLNPKYPDHGLSSLPSCNYMNHDKVNTDTDFLDINTVRNIAANQDFANYPFQIEPIQPEHGKMDLNELFRGRGEKTLYLYSKVFSQKSKPVWLAMGCSAFLQVWWNGEKIYQRDTISRSWPYDIALEVELNKGENDILLKIDMPLDNLDLEIGFKDHAGKHPHQCHWDTELVPYI